MTDETRKSEAPADVEGLLRGLRWKALRELGCEDGRYEDGPSKHALHHWLDRLTPESLAEAMEDSDGLF